VSNLIGLTNVHKKTVFSFSNIAFAELAKILETT